MPHHLGLLAHRDVRLRVLVGPLPVLLGIVAARHRLDVEIVRLLPALVDEVGDEVEPLLVARQPVELDQRDLDLFVPRIAALLARTGPEHRRDVVEIALHDVEELAPPRRLEIGDGALEQMAAL